MANRFQVVNHKHVLLKSVGKQLKQLVQENKKMVHFDQLEDKNERE